MTGPRHLRAGRDLSHHLLQAPCFTDGEMEAQGDEVPCPKPHNTGTQDWLEDDVGHPALGKRSILIHI